MFFVFIFSGRKVKKFKKGLIFRYRELRVLKAVYLPFLVGVENL